MATLKKFNLAGQEIGQVQVDDRLANAEANSQMVKDYIVAIRANARQWSANTKGRSEVSHSTKKPHPQKGTGRARQGMLSAPQYKGGGRVHGPKPKFDQHVKINKKERQAAIRALLGEKIRDNKLILLGNSDMEAPKTKVVCDFLKKSEINGRVLFLGESAFEDFNFTFEDEEFSTRLQVKPEQHVNFVKSVRNIPKSRFMLAQNISGYDVLVAHNIIMTEAAFEEINNWLC